MPDQPLNNTLTLAPMSPGTPSMVCQEHGTKPDFESCIVCMLLWPKEAQNDTTK